MLEDPMLNRKPMNRGSGFKRPERKERKPMILTPIRQGVSFGQSATLPVETPKFEYVRSVELLEACRRIPCQACKAEDGTVVAAHSNQSLHGKGRSVKASDIYVAALCFKCHGEIDQGSKLSQGERNLIWHLAHLATVGELTTRGLWPDGIPVPNDWIEEGQ